MLLYILQVIFFQLSFLLVYELLLKKETFFNYNRFYLLSTPVLAFFLPLLKFPALAEAVPSQARTLLPAVWIGQTGQQTVNLPAILVTSTSGNSINWISIVYFTGVGICFLLFLRKYLSLRSLSRSGRMQETRDFRLIEVPDSRMACTFFKTIFLGNEFSEAEKERILSHELVHVQHRHSFDLLFFEFLKLVFWFNPLIYIFQSRLGMLHEFIADADVVKTTARKEYYNQLLNSAFNTHNITFINQFFNQSLLKKRIVMLQKKQSKAILKFKYLALVPIVLVMLTYVACSEVPDDTPKERAAETPVANATAEKTKAKTPEKSAEDQQKLDKIPFAVIDEVPVFPGCEDLKENSERKDCMVASITNFVNTNFDAKAVKPYSKKGMNRIVVQFRIDEAGKVTDVKARAPIPGLQPENRKVLEKEAIRVVESLPKMEPGKQRGQPVSVMYSLPIIFQNAR